MKCDIVLFRPDGGDVQKFNNAEDVFIRTEGGLEFRYMGLLQCTSLPYLLTKKED